MRTALAPLQALVDNPLPEAVTGGLAGLIGDHPSTYARSPRMWAAAFAQCGIAATYLPLDVSSARLSDVLAWLRDLPACLGVNVTVPYKEAVVPFLDAVAGTARTIGAVNTIVREADGRLTGTNTDGVGLVAALLRPEARGPGDGPLIETPYGLTVLLIGAGGAARAAASALAALLGTGEVLVTDRTPARAEAVAECARRSGGRATAVAEDTLEAVLPHVDLVINASLRGQAGILKAASGWTYLEPYSALAPAVPAVMAPGAEAGFLSAWWERSTADVLANHQTSRERMGLLPRRAAVYDMIYAPLETVILRHARASGLRAANGRWMNIAQAVEAFVEHIAAAALREAGLDAHTARGRVTRVMAQAWGG